MSKHGPEYARQRNEKYFTPAWVTEELLRREGFYGNIYEPAVGQGHILDVIRSMRGGHVFGSDLEPENAGFETRDFLNPERTTSQQMIGVDNIITNPPFGVGGRLAVKFIQKALEETQRQGGKVAMLLPLTFDAAKGRRAIFADCPAFDGKYVLTTRIRWANLEQKAAGPMENHAWYIWNHRRNPKADPFIRYI